MADNYIGYCDALCVPWRTTGQHNRDFHDTAFIDGRGCESREGFSPHAFDDQLRRRENVLALLTHCHGSKLADTDSGSLILVNNKAGLWARIFLSDNNSGREALRLVQGGELTGVSIGFRVLDWGWSGAACNRSLVKTITRARLTEISLCHNPAYKETARRGLDLVLLERPAPVPALAYREAPSGEDESTDSLDALQWAAGEDSEVGFRAKRELLGRSRRLLEYQEHLARQR
jgi:HK97 family phage prohead protease